MITPTDALLSNDHLYNCMLGLSMSPSKRRAAVQRIASKGLPTSKVAAAVANAALMAGQQIKFAVGPARVDRRRNDFAIVRRVPENNQCERGLFCSIIDAVDTTPSRKMTGGQYLTEDAARGARVVGKHV